MLADKVRAKKNMYRIPESVLMGLAALGGSLGALMCMYLFRHKVRKNKFSAGIPLILLLQSILLAICITNPVWL
jgi:uncharacterized membrane protein YsdA (DUF1294 family)